MHSFLLMCFSFKFYFFQLTIKFAWLKVEDAAVNRYNVGNSHFIWPLANWFRTLLNIHALTSAMSVNLDIYLHYLLYSEPSSVVEWRGLVSSNNKLILFIRSAGSSEAY